MTKPLRILHVITGLGVGGAESMLTRLCTLADGGQLRQQVVSLTPGGSNRKVLEQAGVDVRDLGMVRNWPSLDAVWNLASVIRQYQPDVVQSWMYHADLFALAALWLARPRMPVRLAWGVRCSGMDTTRYGSRLWQVIRLCAWLSSRPDAVLANSYAGRDIHTALGYRPKRFEVIPNGIDTEKFRPQPDRRAEIRARLGIPMDRLVVAQVARVDPMKDYETLLAALRELPQVDALLIGEGTQFLPEQPCVHRLGRRLDVPELLTAADLIVSSSAFGEGFSNALAEGMACALPAVSTDVGDARVVLGDTGTIIPPGQPAALAAAINTALSGTPEERRIRAEAARAHIERNFAIKAIIGRFASFYQDLVAPCAE